MNSTLPIVETFHSLQAEGLHFGISAFFIRLGGCKVGCPWCDTKESWPMKGHQKESIFYIAQKATEAQSKGASIIVITGGEPLHHNLTSLCNAINTSTMNQNHKNLPIHLETSGVDDVSGTISWITLSPKRHAPPQTSVLQRCDEIKVVIHKKEDLIFAEHIAKEAIQERKTYSHTGGEVIQPYLFLQPGWESKEGKKLSIEYIKGHPEWRLSLQTHKWLGIL